MQIILNHKRRLLVLLIEIAEVIACPHFDIVGNNFEGCTDPKLRSIRSSTIVVDTVGIQESHLQTR